MPYSVVSDSPDCSGWAVIKDSTGEVLGCHKTKKQAIDQLTAINISEYGERQETFKPTAGMRSEARKGLAWRRELGRGGTLIGVARARDISNGKDLPLATVMRMRSFFARHEVDKKAEGFRPGEKGYPSNGRIAWALWGGDAGKAWADSIASKQDDRTAKALKIIRLLRKIG
jgi:hypothetical protein